MKKILFLFLIALLFISKNSNAQIRNVFVEKYYISDSLDATDTINWTDPSRIPHSMRNLPVGSTTYRIYVQLDSGYKIHKIYGTMCHPLRFTSTADFYNNVDRPDEYFGYMMKRQIFNGNPLLALDSWLTLGLCAKTNTVNYNGVLKVDDTDGSLIGVNGGGTANIASGLMNNNNAAAGIPVDTSDGMMPSTEYLTTWIDDGFKNAASVDTTVFGSDTVGSEFLSTKAYLQQNNGVAGDAATGHKVLVAQLTTKGELTFEINLELIDSTGGIHNGDFLNFVASPSLCDSGGVDTTVLGILKYPPDAPICGCGDPDYLEYNPGAACFNNADSCKHLIVFGCMDSLACNYNPKANFHIPDLCCYPGKCNNRDISLVCPDIASGSGFSLYPNPASDQLNIQLSAGDGNEVRFLLYDSFGMPLLERDLGTQSGVVTQQVDIFNLHAGLYLVRVFVGTDVESKTFMKN